MAQTQIDMLPSQHFDSLLQPGAESDYNNTGCFNVGEQTGKTAGRKQLSAVQARQALQREEILLRNSLSEATQELPVI